MLREMPKEFPDGNSDLQERIKALEMVTRVSG